MMKQSKPLLGVLVFVHIPTHFSEMVRVVELLSGSGIYHPVVLFAAMYTGVDHDIARCRALGADVITERELHSYKTVEQPGSGKLFALRSLGRKSATRVRRGVQRLRSWCQAKTLRISHWLTEIRHFRQANIFLRHAVLMPARSAWSVGNLVAATLKRQRDAWQLRVRNTARTLASCTWRWLYSPTPRAKLRKVGPSGWRVVTQGLAMAPLVTLGALLTLLAYPVRWPLRLLALALFGLWYRRFTPYLPPDILAQHGVARAVPGVLDAHSIGLVVLPEDNFYYFTNFYVKAVHEKAGAAIVVPFTIVNMLEWAEAFYQEPSHDADLLLNSFIAFIFPKWRLKHRGRSLVMPYQQVLCNEYFKIAPPVPWLINSGHTDAIAVESAFMYKYYIRSGIQTERLHLTGALYDDVLHDALMNATDQREKLYQRLNLPSGLPMLLCALPPNQLGGAGRHRCDFSDYIKVLQTFLEPMRKLTASHNCILSLHPRINPAVLTAVDLSGFRVAPDSVAGLIPLSQLYIASCSATIRLAINCGVPVVNYDVYRYDYDDYKAIPGVLTTEEREQYGQAVTRLCTMSDEYGKTRLLLHRFAAEHAQVDGQAGARLLALMEKVTRTRRSQGPS